MKKTTNPRPQPTFVALGPDGGRCRLCFEGAAAAVYYGQFGKMLTTLGFPGRKKHPSTDPANALLSLGYVLLGNEITAMLEARGFDPAIGFLHGLRYGRQSLALDLIEAFRQPVVDRLTLRLLNRRQIGADDFEGGERGLLLKPGPFKTYLGIYEEHLGGASEGAGSPTVVLSGAPRAA